MINSVRVSFARARSDRGAFTLLELIAVMAVITILAGALARPLFQLIKESAFESERVEMEFLIDALEGYIRSEREIPGIRSDGARPTWAEAIARTSSAPLNRIERNARGLERYYIWESGESVYPPIDSRGYIQDSMRADYPAGRGPRRYARIMIVSILSDEAPSGLVSGALGSARFDQIWNWDRSSPIFGLDKKSASESVSIARLALAPLFHLVDLNAYLPDDRLIYQKRTIAITDRSARSPEPVGRLPKGVRLTRARVSGSLDRLSGAPTRYSLELLDRASVYLFRDFPLGRTGTRLFDHTTKEISDLALWISERGSPGAVMVEIWALAGESVYFSIDGSELEPISTSSDGARLALIDSTRLDLYGQARDKLMSAQIKESRSFHYEVGQFERWSAL